MNCRVASISWFALFSAFAPALDAGVVVVDAAGGGDYTTVQGGFTAAQNGDIVIIKSGDYRLGDALGVLAAGRQFVVVGSGPTRPLLPRTVIAGVPPGGSFVLRGVEITPFAFSPTNSGLELTHNFGGVLVEDCVVNGTLGTPGFFGGASQPGWPGLLVHDSMFAAVTRCTIRGGNGVNAAVGPQTFGSSAGGPGVRVVQSALTLYECSIDGGDGGNGGTLVGVAANGGTGCDVVSTVLRASGCTISGGDGGDYAGNLVSGAGAGGNGLNVAFPATAESFDSPLTGGAGGTTNTIQSGPVGAAQLVWSPAAHVIGTASSRSFALSSPVVELTPIQVTYSGTPNDLVLVLPAFAVGHTVIGGTVGWMGLKPPYLAPIPAGTVGPSGTTQFAVNAPALSAPSIEGETFYFQAAFVNAQEAVIGPPTSLTLIRP